MADDYPQARDARRPTRQGADRRTYARGGVITLSDLRANLGLESFPEEFGFAKKLLAVALLGLQLGGSEPAESTEDLLDRLLGLRKDLQARVKQQGRPGGHAIGGDGNGMTR